MLGAALPALIALARLKCEAMEGVGLVGFVLDDDDDVAIKLSSSGICCSFSLSHRKIAGLLAAAAMRVLASPWLKIDWTGDTDDVTDAKAGLAEAEAGVETDRTDKELTGVTGPRAFPKALPKDTKEAGDKEPVALEHGEMSLGESPKLPKLPLRESPLRGVELAGVLAGVLVALV